MSPPQQFTHTSNFTHIIFICLCRMDILERWGMFMKMNNIYMHKWCSRIINPFHDISTCIICHHIVTVALNGLCKQRNYQYKQLRIHAREICGHRLSIECICIWETPHRRNTRTCALVDYVNMCACVHADRCSHGHSQPEFGSNRKYSDKLIIPFQSRPILIVRYVVILALQRVICIACTVW